jgi:hypothetical protein
VQIVIDEYKENEKEKEYSFEEFQIVVNMLEI